MTDETVTGRTMRLIRNEIIEECAKIADKRATHCRAVKSAFGYSGPRQSPIADALEWLARDIRTLKATGDAVGGSGK